MLAKKSASSCLPDRGWFIFLVFFDQSKNNSRTWFDTAACANALNLRAYRERKAARFLAGAVTMSGPEQDDPRLPPSAAGQGWSPTRAIARVSGTPSISRLVIVAARAPRVPFDKSLSAMANTTP